MHEQQSVTEVSPKQPESSRKKTFSSFINSLWNLPIVTDHLLKSRLEARKSVDHFLREIGISDAVALPVGSQLWITDDESDFDFVLLCKTWNTVISIKENDQFQKLAHELNIHLLPIKVSTDRLALSALESQLFAALLTPDYMAIGDISFLNEVRSLILNPETYDDQSKAAFATSSSQFQQRWNDQFRNYVNQYYLNWKALVFPDEIDTEQEEKRSKRYNLFMKTRQSLLGEMSIQSETDTAIKELSESIPTFTEIKDFFAETMQ